MAEDQDTREWRRIWNQIGQRTRNGEIHTKDTRAISAFLLCYRNDYPLFAQHRPKTGHGKADKAKAPRTIAAYSTRLQKYARITNVALVDSDASHLNHLGGKLLRGTDYYQPNTETSVSNAQGTLRKFLRFLQSWEGHHVEADDVMMYDPNQSSSKVNPADMLTRDEIIKAEKSTTNPRDNAIFNFLLYTGARSKAARTLRWKDVKLDSGRWRPNQEVSGLKSFHDKGQWRPLLGAKGPLLAWRKNHPDPSPENFVFCALPGYQRVDPSEHIGQTALSRVMKKIKEASGVEKPMHPHMMRHNFVTICKLEKGLDDSHVKWLIGHSPKSNVMETTYAHISGDDHARKAEEKFGFREPDETENRLTPEQCSVCDAHLDPTYNLCPKCGTPYDHAAAQRREKADEDIHTAKGETARAGDEKGEEAVDKLKKLLRENPGLVDEL